MVAGHDDVYDLVESFDEEQRIIAYAFVTELALFQVEVMVIFTAETAPASGPDFHGFEIAVERVRELHLPVLDTFQEGV